MESLDSSINIETRRMELRGVIRLAGEVIAQYWPMRTFVHHNPLHSLEYLPFEEAVRRGNQFMGGNGYLPSHIYRAYLKSGRIQPRHLDGALSSLVQDKKVLWGSRPITHGEVLRTCLTEGLCTPVIEPLDSQLHDSSQGLIDRLAARLNSVMTFPDLQERVRAIVEGDEAALCRWLTLSHWCDDTLGTEIVQQINDQMIKWCEAYLDEGHATWTMPGREKGLYGAWKALAVHEWSPCGIVDSGKKISQLPDHPEDALLESMDALGIPAELRQDYLSLQLTALPGWAGFIKWRAEERDYPWQQAYPVGLVKFLAIRLWYARELVQQACREKLGIDGRYDAVTAYMRNHSEEYYLRRQRVAGRLARALRRGSRSTGASERRWLGDSARSLSSRCRPAPGGSSQARRGQEAPRAGSIIGHRCGRTRRLLPSRFEAGRRLDGSLPGIGPWTCLAQGLRSRLSGAIARNARSNAGCFQISPPETLCEAGGAATTLSRSTASTCAPNRSAAISNRSAPTRPTASPASLPPSSAIEPGGRNMIRNSSR